MIKVKEIRIHGRAGQGAITTAHLIALAAFEEGKEALAFPHFGAERMGAPMNAFVRISTQPIRIRSRILNPDYVLVLDPTLLQEIEDASEAKEEGFFLQRFFDVAKGLKPDGTIIINSPLSPSQIKLSTQAKIITVPASHIAKEILGRADRANTAILGAFAVTGEISLEALKKAAKIRFPGPLGEKNAEAMQRAYDIVKGKD